MSGGQFIWGCNPQTSIGEMEPNGTDRADDNMGWLWTLSGIPDVFKAKYGVNYFLKPLSFSKKEYEKKNRKFFTKHPIAFSYVFNSL